MTEKEKCYMRIILCVRLKELSQIAFKSTKNYYENLIIQRELFKIEVRF